MDLLIDATQVQERWSIAVTVTDTGIGVPDDQKAYIFTPFTQLSTGFSRVEGGVGLGLYIALSVSDAMGGSLTVSDNPPVAASFAGSSNCPAPRPVAIRSHCAMRWPSTHKTYPPALPGL